jgi:hypothetical protein
MTTLQLQNTAPPYTFVSLGIYNDRHEKYEESTLFPINTTITLNSGKFPLTDYKDLYEHSKQTHCIADKTLKIIGFNNSCMEGQLNKYGNGHIIVEEVVPVNP